MDKTSLGTTTLKLFPAEFLTTKRKTNRVWTLVIIMILGVLAFFFWKYRQTVIEYPVQEVAPATALSTPRTEEQQEKVPENMTMTELETVLSETEIPSFHEAL